MKEKTQCRGFCSIEQQYGVGKRIFKTQEAPFHVPRLRTADYKRGKLRPHGFIEKTSEGCFYRAQITLGGI